MNKITSKEEITLRIDGNTVLEIDSKGCLADDSSTEIAKARLGNQITVTPVSVKEAVKEAKITVTKEEKQTK